MSIPNGCSAWRVSVSIVTYLPEQVEISETFKSVRRTLDVLRNFRNDIYLVDNGDSRQFPVWLKKLADQYCTKYLHGHGNLGFGRGHNLVLQDIGDYHLILNPDVELAQDALKSAVEFMEAHPECGLLSPSACWDDGRKQYLCKRYPTVLDLLLRGFAPGIIRRWFGKRLARYEMQDAINEQQVFWDPPIVSGCFMLFRGEVLRQLGGFDPRFFLYFEDFDLSLRAGQVARIAYVPSVRIVHKGGHAARKGWRHVWMFSRSMVTFFNIHGWKWW